MAVSQVQFFSVALGKWTTFSVILPDLGDGPFPVLFQLHGLSDDHQAWIQRSNLVRHVAGLPLIVVLPDGGTSGYLDWVPADLLNKNRYEALIMNDITAFLKRSFNVTDDRWAIGGLSMGGYGAMRLGLKYPDRFASIWAHSSAFHISGMSGVGFVDPESVATADVFTLADGLVGRENLPEITFDCGVDDNLIKHNRDFDAHLTKIGLPHTYAEHPGAHTWDYWDQHVVSALGQHTRVLGISCLDIPPPF
jgi:S-formylglutathione hydrolase FrmB